MSKKRSPSRALVASGRFLCLALLGLAAPSAAEDLFLCEARDGGQLLTSPPCPPGSTYVGRQPAGSSVPGAEAPAVPGKVVPDPAANPLDAADAARVARAMRMARFQRAVVGLHSLRMYSLNHYQDSGEWPTKPQQLGLDPKTLFDEDIAGVEFHEDGTIEAKLRADFGEDKRVWLRPQIVLGGARMKWNCSTDVSLPKLAGFHSPCQSVESD